jgi:peptide/nickel transport system substrate-binding protein
LLADGISTLDTRSPQVVLEPNLTYWDPKRTPKARIIYENAISKEEAIRSVAAGDSKVDVVADLTPEEAHAFEGGSVAAIHSQPAKTVLAGVFNENKPDSPWRSLEVRRALNIAVDRTTVLKDGVHGYGSALPAFIQPGRYGAVPDMAAYAQDTAAAAKAIEAAGIKGREVLMLASPDWKGVVEVLTADLAKVGLTVKADYSKTEPEGWDIKLVWHFDWSPQYPVGVVHREFFGANGAHRAMPEDPQFDALYAKLLRTPHQPAQEAVVREVEQYVFDQARALFLISPNTLFAVSNRVNFVAYDTCMSELAETSVR